MWNLISQNRNKELKAWIDEDPEVVHIRSSDGKGPLFWAYEYGNKKLVRLLKKRAWTSRVRMRAATGPSSTRKRRQN